MSEDEKKIKVTDRRMFTATGELRDEFRDLGSEERRRASPEPAPPAPSQPLVAPAGEAKKEAETREEFFMLLDLLYQGAVYSLQQSQVAGPEMQQHAAAARQHVDLLAVVQEKTEGNLSGEEKAALDDLLTRLRMAVMDRRG